MLAAGVVAGAAGTVLALRASARSLVRRGSGEGLTQVVIVGAGFAGMNAARSLRGAPVRLTVVDRRNHHLFQPLLYQVASAALSPSDISAPIRSVLRRQLNTEVILGEVVSVDAAAHLVRLGDGRELPFDFLVLASGATHSYFGHDDWRPLAPGLKTVDDAVEIRRRILTAFERAEVESDPAERRALLTFVGVGAGSTGVELAGALSEIARHTLLSDFRRIEPASARVMLLEAHPQVLPEYAPPLEASAQRQLERLGVEVRAGPRVTAVDEDGVTAGGERIRSRTALWATGVQASPLGKWTLREPVTRDSLDGA